MKRYSLSIQKPTVDVVRKYLDRWNTLDNYVMQERSLRKLFTKTYPLNNDLDDILIKVCSLNDFYSTNILSPFKVAKHILNLNIDLKLDAGDLSLVNIIASIQMSQDSIINFYSFASKYCSHHKPDIYPIYDSYVYEILCYFRDMDGFMKFTKNEIMSYPLYCNILSSFSSHYGLSCFTIKEVDRYLWQAGKEYFPRTYSRKKK